MISTSEFMRRLEACSCLDELSNLREELYDELEPQQHALIFARTTYFLSLCEDNNDQMNSDCDEHDEGKCFF